MKLKQLFLLSFCLPLFSAYGQTNAERQWITKIEALLTSKTVSKIEEKTRNQNGGDKKITVFVKDSTPILIILEEKEIINYELVNQTTGTSERNLWVKFYIQNWDKNQLIRVGEIKTKNTQYHQKSPNTSITEISKIDDSYRFDKAAIARMISKK